MKHLKYTSSVPFNLTLILKPMNRWKQEKRLTKLIDTVGQRSSTGNCRRALLRTAGFQTMQFCASSCTSCLNLRSSIQPSVLLYVSLTLQRCAIRKICKLRIEGWNLNSLCHLTWQTINQNLEENIFFPTWTPTFPTNEGFIPQHGKYLDSGLFILSLSFKYLNDHTRISHIL